MLKYILHYPQPIIDQVQRLISEERLGEWLLGKYPEPHGVRNNKALYEYTMTLKNQYLRKSAPLNKVLFDGKLSQTYQALGINVSRTMAHGGKLKVRKEIRIGTLFQNAPEDFLRMIVVHELSHLKEAEHNKSFYQLCCHMEPHYYQLELDTRLYMTQLELFGSLY
ncbi:YgjP-like metallopeptidase domain-containing protein [Endozoicomonas ascidiicola]|uniref:YgjP-like metallopeptidase domain-containing protein n=1 Tax=Endozoicomonas ascidiicola TaxID=1698521 RepID=UPI00082FF887|nr:YgjP-like metallopeptidase domain-containing protein [Endozoicomonas ascidiicola]